MEGLPFDKLRANGSCVGKRMSYPVVMARLIPIFIAMGDREVIHGILADGGQRLDKALAEASGLSRERVKALLGEGRITLDGKPASQASAKAVAGTAYAIEVPPAIPAEAQAQDIPLSIAYEDADLIVVDKPAGLVVHPAAGNFDGTLVNALLHHCAGQLSGIGGVARPGIVHRIDKDTSGLLVAAKTNAAHEGLARQFADHSIERAYLAIVNGVPVPASGTVRGRIGRSSTNRKKMAPLDDGDSRGKHAVTHYKVLKPLGSAALIECRLETGRTHQVRVHMSSIGHALLGDPLYGRANLRFRPILSGLGFTRQALHAAVLGFSHPISGESLRFSSAMPADMRELLEKIERLC
jgi:23S rRNA pseudouridine1911/1915/1917 synthase